LLAAHKKQIDQERMVHDRSLADERQKLEVELQARRKEVAVIESKASQTLNVATASREEATRVKADYEARLARLKSIAT